MKTNENRVVPLSAAHQDFSRVASLADAMGQVITLDDNRPQYLLIDVENAEDERIASDEEVEAVSERLMERNRVAYEVLAK